jgi:hypothetical protein
VYPAKAINLDFLRLAPGWFGLRAAKTAEVFGDVNRAGLSASLPNTHRV